MKRKHDCIESWFNTPPAAGGRYRYMDCNVRDILFLASDTRFSTSDFFQKSVAPALLIFYLFFGPLSIPLGPFRIFPKIRGDIRK
jgi:hypothetical protein